MKSVGWGKEFKKSKANLHSGKQVITIGIVPTMVAPIKHAPFLLSRDIESHATRRIPRMGLICGDQVSITKC